LNLVKEIIKNRRSTFIIGGWENPAYISSMLLLKILGGNFILHYGSTLRSHQHASLGVKMTRKFLFHLADYVVTYGKAATAAVATLGIPPYKIITSFNSVDVLDFHVKAFAYRASMADVTKAHEDFQGHQYLYVGQLIARKNISALLKAFALISEPGDKLTIVGQGPLQAELQNLAKELHVNDSVIFRGNKKGSDLIKEYAQAQTLVIPSENEVWGLVINEALACGLKVVASDRCGAVEDVRNMDGVFISGTDPTSIAQQMAHAKKSWTGHIVSAEILKFTPQILARDLSMAINAIDH
jgi:glycosyltransferase involved in cell wall biosynthesis